MQGHLFLQGQPCPARPLRPCPASVPVLPGASLPTASQAQPTPQAAGPLPTRSWNCRPPLSLQGQACMSGVPAPGLAMSRWLSRWEVQGSTCSRPGLKSWPRSLLTGSLWASPFAFLRLSFHICKTRLLQC